MKYALVVTGLLAALAITAPKLVVFGFFLFVIPGLILVIAPTAFAYMSVTAVVRRLLPVSSTSASTIGAIFVTLLLGWAIMQPFRLKAMTAYRANLLPDVIPEHPIELKGNVRIERPDECSEPHCDYLCLAALDSPGVQSVTTLTAGKGKQLGRWQSAAYELVPVEADPASGIVPNEPGQIVREYLPLVQSHLGAKLITADKAVEAYWAVRLAGKERLQRTNPVNAEVADWIIRIEDQTNHRTHTLRRISISDSDGIVRFRISYQSQAVPAPMFHFGFHANMAGDASFRLGRTLLETGEVSLRPESTLLEAIRFSVPPCDVKSLYLLREDAKQALDDPDATPVRLDLARSYLGSFFFDATEQDYELIEQIVADDRVRDIDEQIKNVFPKHRAPVSMREAYAQRIVMDHTSASLRHWLAERLASLPPGTFADPAAVHLTIWNSPEIYQKAAPFVAMVADLGPERAMPGLEAMLDTVIELPDWYTRRPLVDGIRAALIRLGPQASSAVPRIRELFLRRPSPIMHNAGDADQWRFALARMGVEIENLPVFPNQSPANVERNMRRVADRVQRYEQDTSPEPEE